MANNNEGKIREELALHQKKYDELLMSFNIETIRKVAEVIDKRRKFAQQGANTPEEDLDEETKKVFKLMSKYRQEIKEIFLKHGGILTHITDVPPENMSDGTISRSINKLNHYETQRGNWVFASSCPSKRNPYIARKRDGMTLVDKQIYIYGGDNLKVVKTENGESRVHLKRPNYVYSINSKAFNPVVSLIFDENSIPHFDFSEEWTCDKDVEIFNPNQTIGIEKVTDVTALLEYYQVLSDVNKTGEALRIKQSPNRKEAIKRFIEAIKEGRLRYLNGEAGINSISINEYKIKDEAKKQKDDISRD